MTEKDKQLEELIAAWVLASERLAIRVVAPFDFKVGATLYKCIAYLPDFGSPKGMLVQATFPPNFATDEALASNARKVGYYITFVNANSYSTFDLQEFQDALKDWGFYGSPAICPEWIGNSPERVW